MNFSLVTHRFLVLAILLTGMIMSVWFKKLSLIGAITGGVCGWLVFVGSGFTGIAIMTIFFVVATLATSWKVKDKREINAAEENKGRRKASQVLANAGVAAIAGVLAHLYNENTGLWKLLIAASFSAATADTLASELGTVYGKRFYNILTFKPDIRGLDGVISFEGILIGMAGSTLIAAVYAIGFGWSSHWTITIVAGTSGNLADSILGAGLERKGIIKNNAVNFLNTLIAALVAAGMYSLIC
jgi:uncharacterized protein (TIGR00297 family)